MVWSAFSAEGTTDLAFLEHKQTPKDYLNSLETYTLPYAYASHRENFRFMQDDSSIHTACICNEWFHALNVDVISWAANSLDLNPIENTWRVPARFVYHNRKQYSTVKKLKIALLECWHNLDCDF